MKRILLLSIIVATILFAPLFSAEAESEYDIELEESAGSFTTYEVTYEGMVPCGRCLEAERVSGGTLYSGYLEELHDCESDEIYVPCTFCHGFIIFDNLINFFLVTLFTPVALLVIVISGILLMSSEVKPELKKRGKRALTAAIIGLVIAYFSWAVIVIVTTGLMSDDWDSVWSGMQMEEICDEIEIQAQDLE